MSYDMNTEEFRCPLSLYTAKGCSRETIIKTVSFYNFPEDELRKDILERKKNPAKVDQCTTNLCGIAAIAYMYASRNYADYAQFVTNMHRNGIATSKAGYIVTTDKDRHLQHYSRRSPSYPRNIDTGKQMYPADFIFLTSIADFENALLDYDPSNPNLWEIVAKAIEGTSAFTMPQIVEKLMRKLIGFKTVEWKNAGVNINSPQFEIIKELGNIARDIENGYTICMMSNGNLFHGTTAISPTHWIVIEKLTISRYGDAVKLECFTWGKIVGKESPFQVPFEIFFSNNFGYFRAK